MGFLINEATYKRSTSNSDKVINNIIDIIALNDNNAILNVNANTALLQSDIFTAVRIISSDIASATYKVNGNEMLEDLFNKKANASTPSHAFLFSLIANTLLNGNGYALIERDKNGLVTGLRNVKSGLVTVLESDDGKKLGYKVLMDNETLTIDSTDMIHIKTFTVDGKIGISPIYSLKPELAMQKNGVSLMVNTFKKGIATSGILTLKKGNLNNESKKSIRESFEEANSGAQNSGSVMVLGENEEFKQLAVDTKVLDMIQNNKYSTQQIAKGFGIPLSRFGQELVNSSDVDANDIYITSTLNAYKIILLQEFCNKLNIDLTIEFDVLQARDKEALFYKFMSDKQGEGILTVNEVRSFYGFSDVEGGDKVYKNSANQTLANLEKGVK